MAGYQIGSRVGPALGGLAGLIGSAGNPMGGAAGVGLGGALGGGLDYLLNSLYPEQQQMNQQVQGIQNNPNIDYLRQQLRNQNVAYDPRGFQDIENQERQNFRDRTIPDIMERFAGLGLSRSSALPEALAGAGTDLGTRLNAMRHQFALQRGGANMNRLNALGGLEGGQQRLGLENQMFGLRQQQLAQNQQQIDQAGNIASPQNYMQLLNYLGQLYAEDERATQGQQTARNAATTGIQKYTTGNGTDSIYTPRTEGH